MSQPLDGSLFGKGQPCFGCAPDHPIGFRLSFEEDGDDVVTRFMPEARYQGPPGILHGGLTTTLADEIGAWTIITKLGKFGFTAELSAKLRRPVRIGTEVVGRGRIENDRRRIVDVDVTLSQDGETCMSANLRFVILDEKGAERMLGRPLPPGWLRFGR
jgi:uncharacterized protein (TIGR00369 family)